jgi:peptide/nickel transport system substrate-binding protein
MIGKFLKYCLMLAGIIVLHSCSEAPQTGVGLTIGFRLEPPSLDPTYGAAAATDEIVYANIFEGLTRVGGDGKVHPALAKSWSVDDAGLVYDFMLQQGVRFHDGTKFDADDVKFSLDRARAPGSINAQKSLFAMIESVEVIAPDHVRIILSQRVADFPFNMAWGDAVIVAPESAEKNASFPIGTGPFKFSRWQKGTGIHLLKNPDYWGEPVSLDWVKFNIVPDSAASYAALMAGDLDGFTNFPAPELLRQIGKDKRFNIVVGETEGETILGINNQKPPFDNVLVRRAISHAIDREAIITGAMFGHGTPIGSFFSPADPAYVDLLGMSNFDPKLAKDLLAQAGYPDGFSTTIKLPPPYYARRGGEIIASQLRAVGIETKIQYMEWAQWLDQVLGNKNYDLTIVSHTEPRDINFFARDDNYFGYRSEDFKRLMSDIEAAPDVETRTRYYQQAQRMLAEDAVCGFLFELPKIGVWRTNVSGYWVNSPIQATDLTGVHITTTASDTP